jgi:hypothetical protein
VATQEGEGAKDRGDRLSLQFVHDPTPLCPDSACEATSPSVLVDNVSLAHETASTETVCLSAGTLVSADEVSQTVALDKDRRAETISPGQYSRPRNSKSARIDDRIQHPWLRLMWVLVMMSL